MSNRILKWLTNNLSLKVWSLLTALLLWFHVTTEKVVEEPFRIPLETYGVPDNLVLLSPPPDELEVRIRGRGKQILRLKLSRRLIARVDLSKARRGEVGFTISSEMITLPPWTTGRVSRIVSPRELRLDFDREARRSVEVSGSARGVPREGYVQVGDPVVNPTTVTLVGGRRDVREIETLEAEPVDISGLAETATRKARVVPPDEFSFSCIPESVAVTVNIEELVELSFDQVPIKVFSSGQAKVQIEPPSIALVLSGPRSSMEELKPEDVAVTVDLKGASSGDDSLRASVTPPRGISVISAEPEWFRVRL